MSPSGLPSSGEPSCEVYCGRWKQCVVGGGRGAPGTEMRMSQAGEEGEYAWMERRGQSVKCRGSEGKVDCGCQRLRNCLVVVLFKGHLIAVTTFTFRKKSGRPEKLYSVAKITHWFAALAALLAKQIGL